MKRQAGFTLIELVVVIVILGILAITAAPKFLNMQGDARVSALNGMKAAMQSASSMVYSKAIIKGVETSVASSVTAGSAAISTVYGYPEASSNGIGKTLSDTTNDWTVVSSGAAGISGTYTIRPTSAPSTCIVTYQAASSSSSAPTISVADASACGN